MQWFKHKTSSHDDPHISECEDIYGDAGYTIFFKLLEIYGQEFRHLEDGWLDVSQTFVRRKLRKSWTKVEQVLNFYQEKNRICFTSDYGRLRYKVPGFIELASNWTSRKEPKPTEAPTEAPTAIEQTKKKKEKKTKEQPPKPPFGSDVNQLVREVASSIKSPSKRDSKIWSNINGVDIPWSFRQSVITFVKDHYQAGLVFYRAYAAGAKNPMAWIRAGLKGEMYALKASKDEYDDPKTVKAWMLEEWK